MFQSLFCLIMLLAGTCFSMQIPILQDSPENQETRIMVAIASIKTARHTLSRIQGLTHDDPDKAADLCFNAIKFLMNAEAFLNNEKIDPAYTGATFRTLYTVKSPVVIFPADILNLNELN